MVKSYKERVLLIILIILSAITIGIVRADTKNIVLDNVAVKEKSGTAIVDPKIDGNKITSNVIFNQKDDYVTFEVTLRNKEELSYQIESITDNNTNENIGIEYKFSEDYIEKDQIIKIEIKVSYKSKLINQEQISLDDLTVTLNMLCEDDDEEKIIIFPITGNETEEEQGIENPTTRDNILRYVLIVVIATLGLAIIRSKRGKQGARKTVAVVLIMIIAPIVMLVLARESYSVPIKLTGIIVKGEFEKYNVVINQNNDQGIIAREVTYGQPLGELPADPIKEGYTFDKWVDKEGNEVTADRVITGPIEIEAKYNVVEYGITYDLAGGNLPTGVTNPDKYTVETETFTLNNPERAGYTFVGWSEGDSETKTANLTIEKGTTGEKSYKANYIANEATKYTVVHRYQNLEDLSTYTEEEKEEYGETDTEVTAPVQERKGFETPAVQTVVINGDESSRVTYTYDRSNLAFSISDRTYIDNDASTSDGEYLYGTSITVKANARAGYDFRWNDNSTSYEKTFTLEDPTVVTPVYIARTDTPYTVKHMKQKSSLDGYELATEQNLTGTTDTTVTPAVNSYVGYNSPSAQSVTIAGDGSAEVTYYYDIKILTFAVNENVETSYTNPTYPYGTSITVKAKTLEGKEFVRWNNNVMNNPYTFTIKENTTLEPIYKTTQVTVSFNTAGGSEVASQTIDYNQTPARPTTDPTRGQDYFVDWYTDTSYTTLFDFGAGVKANTTVYAKWIDANCVAAMNGEGYTSIKAAVTAAGTTESTIKLLKNTQEIEIHVVANQNILLDLNNKTLANDGYGNVIENYGVLKVTNGTITTDVAQAAINNNEADARLTLTNMTINVTSSTARQTVYNDGGTSYIGEGVVLTSVSNERANVQNVSGTVIIDGARITSTGKRGSVYNEKVGSVTEIRGNTYISATPLYGNGNLRGAVQALNGIIKITGGTIISDNCAVRIEKNGKLIVGTEDGSYNVTTPVIRGGKEGINSDVSYPVYDGIIEGKTYAVNDEAKINGTESGFTKVNEDKTVDGETYHALYYKNPNE